jgi:hypothetical protein
MKTVAVIHLCLMFPSTFLFLQLTGDWLSDNVATGTKKKGFGGQRKIKWKRNIVSRIWSRKLYDPKEMGKQPKLSVHLKRTDRVLSVFESLNEVT